MSKYKRIIEDERFLVLNTETGEKSEAVDFEEDNGTTYFHAFGELFGIYENDGLVNIDEELRDNPPIDKTAMAAAAAYSFMSNKK